MCVGFLYTVVRRVLFSRVTKQSREDISLRTVAQLVAGRAVMLEVLKCCLCNYISKWLDLQVFSSKGR